MPNFPSPLADIFPGDDPRTPDATFGRES